MFLGSSTMQNLFIRVLDKIRLPSFQILLGIVWQGQGESKHVVPVTDRPLSYPNEIKPNANRNKRNFLTLFQLESLPNDTEMSPSWCRNPGPVFALKGHYFPIT